MLETRRKKPGAIIDLSSWNRACGQLAAENQRRNTHLGKGFVPLTQLLVALVLAVGPGFLDAEHSVERRIVEVKVVEHAEVVLTFASLCPGRCGDSGAWQSSAAQVEKALDGADDFAANHRI